MFKAIQITVLIFFSIILISEENVEACTLIDDDIKRLDCFDNFFRSAKDFMIIDSNSVIEIKANEEEVIDPQDAPKENVEIEANIPAAKTISLKASKEVIERFLTIESINRIGSNYSIKLNDGSQWKTNESIFNKSLLKSGVSVSIEKGSFGSQFLKFKGTKTKIRVKKLK